MNQRENIDTCMGLGRSGGLRNDGECFHECYDTFQSMKRWAALNKNNDLFFSISPLLK
jgi:hypothetical protein